MVKNLYNRIVSIDGDIVIFRNANGEKEEAAIIENTPFTVLVSVNCKLFRLWKASISMAAIYAGLSQNGEHN